VFTSATKIYKLEEEGGKEGEKTKKNYKIVSAHFYIKTQHKLKEKK
jgi:hypothetical protein